MKNFILLSSLFAVALTAPFAPYHPFVVSPNATSADCVLHHHDVNKAPLYRCPLPTTKYTLFRPVSPDHQRPESHRVCTPVKSGLCVPTYYGIGPVLPRPWFPRPWLPRPWFGRPWWWRYPEFRHVDNTYYNISTNATNITHSTHNSSMSALHGRNGTYITYYRRPYIMSPVSGFIGVHRPQSQDDINSTTAANGTSMVHQHRPQHTSAAATPTHALSFLVTRALFPRPSVSGIGSVLVLGKGGVGHGGGQ